MSDFVLFLVKKVWPNPIGFICVGHVVAMCLVQDRPYFPRPMISDANGMKPSSFMPPNHLTIHPSAHPPCMNSMISVISVDHVVSSGSVINKIDMIRRICMIGIIRVITIIITINMIIMISSKIICSRDAKKYSVGHVNGTSFIVISFTCAVWYNELTDNLTSSPQKPELSKTDQNNNNIYVIIRQKKKRIKYQGPL